MQNACRLCQESPAAELRGLCSRCAGSIASGDAPLHSITAAVAFEGRIREWIHGFKYPPQTGVFDATAEIALGALIARAARLAPGARPGCIVPIPLHPRRLRARGFNPAAVLARSVARHERVPVDYHWLERARDTPSQTGLDRSERSHNVAGAFRVVRGRRGAAPLPPRVWLIDDVVTTGSTLASAAQALRSAGVREVSALCAARTLRPGEDALR